ncbi:diguanylate cyclase (GGDEF) domain-containing protein [Lachnospiraceae bacterium YSD2013]|nr:diguanylate cyclase (GGDEF) domain-containing protein [Lachnospiraceae bacterium YSD2013]
MGRFNEGTVFTNENCIGCSKCISVCPVFGANVSRVIGGKQSVEVSKKCIDCGLCVVACEHGAREYRDDLEAVIRAISEGKKVSALIDPVLYIIYGTKAPLILGFLKDMGIHRIYDVSYGAEICMYAHAKYIKEHMDKNGQCRQFIANTCGALNNYISSVSPQLIKLMIPVQSPVTCTAIYTEKYLKDDSELVVISPCITQVDEVRNSDNGGHVKYSVTVESLMNYIESKGLGERRAEADLTSEGLGNIIAYNDGFIEGVSAFFSKEEIFTNLGGIKDVNIENLSGLSGIKKSRHSLMVTADICRGGCVCGTGLKASDVSLSATLDNYRKIRAKSFNFVNSCISPDEYYLRMSRVYKDLNFDDFSKTLSDRYRQPYIVPEDAINDIFNRMHKDTELKRTINCRSCGYKTCKDLAVAVSNGYARIQDCVHYMNDDLKYSSLLDKMSGVANREGFAKKANEILQANPDKKYILLVGNVNKLKNVNDLYGTEMGDMVLIHVAKTIEGIVGRHGTCGRFGGGVFAVMIEDNSKYTDALLKLESFNASRLGVFFPITIRFGMYRITDSSLKLSNIVNLCTYAADKATDRTKNTFIEYTDIMRKEMQEETDITLKMHDAMTGGEFVLFMQPQYNHHNGKMVGAEALCRWLKQDGSIVSPGIFIPVFEKNGFIKELDKYVWESAFKLVQQWEKQGGPQVPISVNISRISLENDEVISVIKELAKKYPINKKNLYFEITESAYMKDQAALTERVYKLKEIGFAIAMDDFGSGYSSLNSLKDIPIDVLKLDMGFLRGGTNVERGNEIITYMVHMAKALKLKIVAEGVELKEQADFLTKEGCDVIQGYFYAKPMPLTDFEEKVKVET